MLATHFGSIDALMDAGAEQIVEIPGIGNVIAESVVEFFADDDNRALVEKLRAAGVNLSAEKGAAREGPLSGLTFVVTGRLERLSRDAAESLIKQHGGAVSQQRQQEDQLPRRRRRSRQQTHQSPATRNPASSKKTAFIALLTTHNIQI